jgi:hypothetical protein
VIEGDTLQQFDGVVTPFLLPDGSLVVPQGGRGTPVIRVFAPDGSFSRSLGGPGEGPGEFKALQQAWNRGDTIEAWDGRQSRLTRFLPDGAVETIRLMEGPLGPKAALPGTFGEGWAFSRVEAAPPGERDQMGVYRFLRSGEYAGRIGSLQGMLRFEVPDIGSDAAPLSPKWLMALQKDRVFLGESLTPRIAVVDTLGDTLRVISWTPDPSPPVEEALGAVIDSAVASVPYEGYKAYLARTPLGVRGFYEAAPIPEKLSVAWGMIVDSEGFVWIRPYEPLRHAAALGGLSRAGRGGTWVVFSPSGDRVGQVAIPDDLEPIQITRDAVVGIRIDELGVQYVRVYALTRS